MKIISEELSHQEQFNNEPFCTKGLEHDFIACEREKAKTKLRVIQPLE